MHELTMLLPGSFPADRTASLKVETGDPAQSIEVLALLESATLIVVGLKEGWAFEDHAPGSTLAHIVREASCPVLCVRAHSS